MDQEIFGTHQISTGHAPRTGEGSVRTHMLAAIEVMGRHAVSSVPPLRSQVTRWVRRARVDVGPIKLAELEARLMALGVGSGRDLLVHSSWARMGHVDGKATEVLNMLLRLVGNEATLLMPSHPYLTSRNGLQVYDVQNSFSTVGLLSEVLRRTPGAQRSPCPIAPVCALGPAARYYTNDFREESGGTPYGQGSPYWQLGQRGGQVVVLGIDFIRALTLMHVAFDVLGGENLVRDYYEPATYLVIQDGQHEEWNIRRVRPSLEDHLATAAFRKMIVRSGLVGLAEYNGVPISLVDARAFLDWHLPLARKHGWPYWGFRKTASSVAATSL